MPGGDRPAGWPAAVGEYLTAMRAAGRAPGTVKLHRYYLDGLAETYRSPWTVTTRDLLAFLSVEHWAPETRKSARGCVRGFYRWAHGSGYLTADPAADLPTVRIPLQRPTPAPEHLVRRLVSSGDGRLAFMAALASYAGCRRAEIAQVHRRDLVGDVLTIHGKGGKTRRVPILDPFLLACLEGVEGWAFPGRDPRRHLTADHVGRLLSRAMPAGWSGHKLRTRCLTQAYAGCRDLLAVMELGGHSRPETTLRYVLLPDDAVRAAVVGTALAS